MFILSIDEVSSLKPMALQSGGFIFTITLKATLQILISLRFVYTEVGTGHVDIVRSTISFFNSSIINYVVFQEDMQFEEFKVGVALEHGMISGPLFSDSAIYSELNIDIRRISKRSAFAAGHSAIMLSLSLWS